MLSSVQALVARAMKTRVLRVLQHYSSKNGPILAGGLSLTALYSIFAALYLAFALLGLALEAHPTLKRELVNTVATAIPGLIDRGAGGAIDLEALFKSRVLGWSSVLAVAALLVTALSWFASTRSAIRALFELKPDTTNFLLLKLRDFGLVTAFAVVMIASTAASVLSTRGLSALFELLRIDNLSAVAIILVRIMALLLVVTIDTMLLAMLFRVLLAMSIPGRRLFNGALLGALALGGLQLLGASIVGGGGANPLLASFAVILGLLVWFGIACQVILFAATWIAVDLADHGEIALTAGHAATEHRHRPRPRVRPGGRPGGRLR